MNPSIFILSTRPEHAQVYMAALRGRYAAVVLHLAHADLLLPDDAGLSAAQLVVVDVEEPGERAAALCRKLRKATRAALLLVAPEPAAEADGYLPVCRVEACFLSQVELLLKLKQLEEKSAGEDLRLQRELDHRSLALRETEHRFRVIFEASPDAVFVEDENGVVLDANPAACRLHGMTKDRLVGSHVADLVPPAQREAVIRDFPLWFSGALQVYEGFSHTLDGRIIPIELKASRIEYRDKPALLLIARDISERRGSEERRSVTVQGLRAIVEIADDLIGCTDIVMLRRKAVELARERLGLERAAVFLSDGRHAIGTFGTDMKGQTTDERSHRFVMDDAWRARFQLRGQHEPRWSISLEHLQEWQNGVMQSRGTGWVAVTPIQTDRKAVGVFINDSAITKAPFDPVKQEIVAVYCSMLANIMERKAAESDRSRLAMAVEQSAEAVLIADVNGTISYVNPAFERITGYPAREVTGLNPRILKSGRHDLRFYERMWAQLRAGEIWSGRITNRRKDGTLYEAEQTISPMRDGSGQVVGYLTVSQDVTRSAQMENELRQAQKMDSIGRLAGGIAHDFNNLLTGILGFAKVIRDDLGPEHPSQADLQEIVAAGERAAVLSRQLMAFGHREVLQIKPVDLAALLVNLHSLLRRTLGEHIELVTVAADRVPTVEADPGLMEQVIMNLAVNARDAMPRGGQLVLRTGSAKVDASNVRLHPDAKPGDYVLLAVKDTGYGMTDEVKQKAFEPFFTTKEQGRGLGLGLSTVYGIVRQFGGFLELDTEVNKGTEIRIYLPASSAVAAEKVVAEKVQASGGGEVILVVEDESTVRNLTVRLLRRMGYQILEARNGDEALSIYRQNPGIHLVLTDVIMPRMGGPELAAHLRQENPGVRILYMSGYTEDVRMEGSPADQTTAIVLKPFTRESLATEVRRALES